jgi:hypothetical protein
MAWAPAGAAHQNPEAAGETPAEAHPRWEAEDSAADRTPEQPDARPEPSRDPIRPTNPDARRVFSRRAQ